ncbi:MAG: T9SS type A sorting domain-containing protein [Prolixibacteraceae bacterium]
MNKIIFILLLCLSILSEAQTNWSKVLDETPNSLSKFHDMILVHDTVIIVSNKVGLPTYCGHDLIMAFNKQGQYLWETSGFCDVFALQGNNLLLSYQTRVDDVILDDFFHIDKLDANKQLSSYTKFPEQGYMHKLWEEQKFDEWDKFYTFNFKPIDLKTGPKNQILVAFNEGIARVDSTGQFFFDINKTTRSSVLAVDFLSDNRYLLFLENAINLLDDNLNILKSSKLEQNAIGGLLDNDTIYILTENQLIVRDTSFNIISTIQLPENFISTNLKTINHKLWISGTTNDQITLFTIHNTEIKTQNNYNQLVTEFDFAEIDGEIIIMGNSPQNQFALYSCDTTASYFGTEADIELVDAKIGKTQFTYAKFDGQSFFVSSNFEIFTRVKNSGKDTIRSLALFAPFKGGFNCAVLFYYTKYDDLHLLPGDELTLKGKGQCDYQNFQFTLMCMAPNSQLETNLSNNYFSELITLTGVDDIVNENSFQLYPNPVKEILTIKVAEHHPFDCDIYNSSGQKILNRTNIEMRLEIDVRMYPNGIYFAKLQIRDKAFSYKFEIQ